MLKIALLICISFAPLQLFSTPLPVSKPNPSRLIHRSQINPSRADASIALVWNVFKPIIAQHEARLIFEKYWNNTTVNLYAEQASMTWFIHVFGGYLQLPFLSNDAFQLSLCHEIGHHLAGFPYKSAWSSVEGQTDYFASHACLNLLWKNDHINNQPHQNTVDTFSKSRCDAVYSDVESRWLCYRKATAALNLTQSFALYLNQPAIDPSLTQWTSVPSTLPEHASLQCRFETLMRGALCPKAFNWKKIPGKIPGQVVPVPRDPVGSNALWAEQESSLYVCTESNPQEARGARPSCWYYDRLKPKGNKNGGLRRN